MKCGKRKERNPSKSASPFLCCSGTITFASHSALPQTNLITAAAPSLTNKIIASAPFPNEPNGSCSPVPNKLNECSPKQFTLANSENNLISTFLLPYGPLEQFQLPTVTFSKGSQLRKICSIRLPPTGRNAVPLHACQLTRSVYSIASRPTVFKRCYRAFATFSFLLLFSLQQFVKRENLHELLLRTALSVHVMLLPCNKTGMTFRNALLW
jgi:hypothetical protein